MVVRYLVTILHEEGWGGNACYKSGVADCGCLREDNIELNVEVPKVECKEAPPPTHVWPHGLLAPAGIPWRPSRCREGRCCRAGIRGTQRLP